MTQLFWPIVELVSPAFHVLESWIDHELKRSETEELEIFSCRRDAQSFLNSRADALEAGGFNLRRFKSGNCQAMAPDGTHRYLRIHIRREH